MYFAPRRSAPTNWHILLSNRRDGSRTLHRLLVRFPVPCRETHYLRPLFQQPKEVARRNMAFDHVAIDPACMTRNHLLRDRCRYLVTAPIEFFTAARAACARPLRRRPGSGRSQACHQPPRRAPNQDLSDRWPHLRQACPRPETARCHCYTLQARTGLLLGQFLQIIANLN